MAVRVSCRARRPRACMCTSPLATAGISSWRASPSSCSSLWASSGPWCSSTASHSRWSKRVRSHSPCCGRSEEHTSELQSRENLVCRLLLEKKKKKQKKTQQCKKEGQDEMQVIE